MLATEFLPNWGGVGTYCIELAKALADKVELHVVTLGREEKGKLAYSKEDIQEFFDGKIQAHLLTRAPAGDTFYYNAKMQFAVYMKLGKLAKEYHFDLVHSNFPQSRPSVEDQRRTISSFNYDNSHYYKRTKR